MIQRSELESEVAMLQRELASIRSSTNRSHELSDRLEDESHELKGRIESTKYEEERNRKEAEELEEQLAELSEEVTAQLDELERINGVGGRGVGRKMSRAMRSLSFHSVGDAISVGARSRTSSAGDSIADELENRLLEACSVGDSGTSAHTDGELDMRFADEVSVRSRHASSESGSPSSRPSSRRASRRAPSELQKQWEAAYSNPTEKQRSRSRGGKYESDRQEQFVEQSSREDTSVSTGNRPSSRAASYTAAPQRNQEGDIDRRYLLRNSTGSVGNLAQSIHGLFKSLGQEVDGDEC